MQITISSDNVSVFCARLRAAAPEAPEAAFHPEGYVVIPDNLGDVAQAIIAAGFAPTKAELKAYAADRRYAKETGGTTISGVAYPTDRETQAKMTAAVLLGQVNAQVTFKWKVADGSFVDLDVAGITAVASAAGAFVQACFATEATVVAAIDAGTIVNRGQIDVAFA